MKKLVGLLQMYRACKQAAPEHKEQSLPSSTTDIAQGECTNPAVETSCQPESEAAQTQDGSSQNSEDPQGNAGRGQQGGVGNQKSQDPQSNADRGQQGDIGRGCAELQQELAKDEEVQVRAEAAVQRGASNVPVLVSGAGHDGLAMANLTQVRVATIETHTEKEKTAIQRGSWKALNEPVVVSVSGLIK